ncbi:MAG: VTT domain-containing protein [Candidatus Nomurabacteria bacterium]|nr:VTT domain-containing protein [Candidatus Nomurabacteria bacterium]
MAFIIFAETGLMIGFFLPGDSLLFTVGALAGLGIINVNIWLMAAIFFVAAVIGNSVGYLIGKHFGRKLFRKKDSRLFRKKYLVEAEKFYEKHGAAAVILAQFMPIIRTFNPIVTGISKMNYVKFITFNIVGAFIWTGGFTLAGYYLFQAFGQLIDPEKIDVYILPIIVLIVFLSVLPAVIHVLRDEARRRTIFSKLKFWSR